jgi:hypothetical protein
MPEIESVTWLVPLHQDAIAATLSGTTAPAHVTVRAISGVVLVQSPEGRGIRVSAALHSAVGIHASATMTFERIQGVEARSYTRGTAAPAAGPILLLRAIEARPERAGAGRVLLDQLCRVADGGGLWSFLVASPSSLDLDRVLRVFRAAGFTEIRPGAGDDIFVRPLYPQVSTP